MNLGESVRSAEKEYLQTLENFFIEKWGNTRLLSRLVIKRSGSFGRISRLTFQLAAAIAADLCFRKFLIKNPVRISTSSLV